MLFADSHLYMFHGLIEKKNDHVLILFSGIDLKKCSFTNYGVTEKVDRKHEICSMSWVDEDENQV